MTTPLPTAAARAQALHARVLRWAWPPLIGCGVMLALGTLSVDARVGAQPVPPMQSGPVGPAPIQPVPPVETTPLQASGSPQAPPIEPAGSPQAAPMRITGPNDPALVAELARLQATANRPARRGSAAEKSAAHAAWLLGLLALHGKGGPADPAQAQRWFERARTLGEPLANAGLAWCQIDGCIPPPRPGAARPYLASLRAVDPGRALYLEWLAQTRQAPLQVARPAPLTSAPAADALPNRALLVRAAQAGDAQALVELGLDSVATGHPAQALEQFRSAAARSPAAAANAERLASRLQASGSAQTASVPPARSAQDWFLDARRYHRGDGVPANYSEAIRLYQIAAAGGSRSARHMLELIYSRPASNGAIDIAWMQQLAALDVTRDSASAVPPFLPAISPQMLARDPTPLYDLLPPAWRDNR